MSRRDRMDPSIAGGLTPSQRRSVLRVAAIAIALALTVPCYYGVVAVAPAVTTVVPPVVVHGAMGVGLCLVFPATFVYAHVLANRPGNDESVGPREYGVDDQWERRNL